MEDLSAFLWIMLILKIPLAMLLWLVWWSIKQAPEVEDDEPRDDGGSKKPRPHPPARPKRRPRGPHGDPAPLPAPPRVRTVARGRNVEKQR